MLSALRLRPTRRLRIELGCWSGDRRRLEHDATARREAAEEHPLPRTRGARAARTRRGRRAPRPHPGRRSWHGAAAVAVELAEQARSLGCATIEVLVTSPGRQAANGEELREALARGSGLATRILSADEEARLAYFGALSAVRSRPESVAVVDVGGGSAQLVVGTAESGPVWARSVDIGSLRLTRRLLRSDPPTYEELDAARDEVERSFEAITPPLPQAALATGGTARALRRHRPDSARSTARRSRTRSRSSHDGAPPIWSTATTSLRNGLGRWRPGRSSWRKLGTGSGSRSRSHAAASAKARPSRSWPSAPPPRPAARAARGSTSPPSVTSTTATAPFSSSSPSSARIRSPCEQRAAGSPPSARISASASLRARRRRRARGGTRAEGPARAREAPSSARSADRGS